LIVDLYDQQRNADRTRGLKRADTARCGRAILQLHQQNFAKHTDIVRLTDGPKVGAR